MEMAEKMETIGIGDYGHDGDGHHGDGQPFGIGVSAKDLDIYRQ